jgi:hypothetical protein
MEPLTEILLSVACYYPEKSDPHRGPVEMLEGDYDKYAKVLNDAVEQGYVKRNDPLDPHSWTWELTRKGRYALFYAIMDYAP